MNDRFKFRVWNKEQQKLYSWDDLLKSKEDNSFYWCMLQVQNDEKNNILMQCTGLKDKNGKLIYEGDVVREYFGETGTYQVVFCPYIAQWEWVNLNDERPNWEMFSEQFEGMAEHQGISTDLEVIGNIYENPELLEVSE